MSVVLYLVLRSCPAKIRPLIPKSSSLMSVSHGHDTCHSHRGHASLIYFESSLSPSFCLYDSFTIKVSLVSIVFLFRGIKKEIKNILPMFSSAMFTIYL